MGEKKVASATQHKMHTGVLFLSKNNQFRFPNSSITESLNSIETLVVLLLKDAPTKLGFSQLVETNLANYNKLKCISKNCV